MKRDALLAQDLRIDPHLELTLSLAPDRDIGHAWYREQAGPDRPASENRHLDRAQLLGGEPNHQDTIRRRQRLQHLWRTVGCVRQAKRRSQAFLHQLPGVHRICPWLEDEDNTRETGERLGVVRIEPGHPRQQVFLDGCGEDLFHLRR
ncbi:hypothetical protein HRbin28_01888 [bacterium HR28]|nr:hypothetical protein HRbin28_01888 [bacterium HR28]